MGEIKKLGGVGQTVYSDDLSAISENVLEGKTYMGFDTDDEIIEGTMPNNGAQVETLGCGERVSILYGFHNGEGAVSVRDLASQTPGNAASGDIISGEFAFVNGSKVTGDLQVSNFQSFWYNGTQGTNYLGFTWVNPSGGLFHGMRLVIKAWGVPGSPTDGSYVDTVGSNSAAGAQSAYTFYGLSHSVTYYCRIYSYAIVNGQYVFGSSTTYVSAATKCSYCRCNCDNDGRNEYSCMDAFIGRGTNGDNKGRRSFVQRVSRPSTIRFRRKSHRIKIRDIIS